MSFTEEPSGHAVPFVDVATGQTRPIQLFERPVRLDAVGQH